MLWRVISLDLTKVIFASCFTLRVMTRILIFYGFFFLVARITLLIET